LPVELVQVDAYLDQLDGSSPSPALFDRRRGRPQVPVDPLLRLLFFKHRYQSATRACAARSATRSGGGGLAVSG
jgi:hypothetical protein